MWMPQCHQESWTILGRHLWGADLQRDIWAVCTQPSTAIRVRHVSGHSPTTLPGNHKADTLAKEEAVLLEELQTPSDVAKWLH